MQSADRRYYDALVTALRANTVHVYSVTDLWAAPTTESAARRHYWLGPASTC
ncbi:MAG TPA: hypothetical protein VE197_02135 [Mycobacterium sp.]|nr:hypothetical protein [Mycobacterium sp.]